MATIVRRELLAALGSAAALPVAARAQQPERMRRIGVLMNRGAEPDGQARLAAFQQALQQLSWSNGRNLRIDIRWGENDAEKNHAHVAISGATSAQRPAPGANSTSSPPAILSAVA